MRVEDIKKYKKIINEGLSDWIGDYGAAAVQRTFGKGAQMSTKDTATRNIFIKDLVGRATQTIQSAIQGGMIDPNATTTASSPSSTTTTAGSSGTTPAATASPSAGATAAAAPNAKTAGTVGNAAAPNAAQKQASQNLNNYIRSAASYLNTAKDKNQKIAMVKELVNYMADRKGYPEWQNALSAVSQVISRSGMDQNFTNSAVNRLKAGSTMEAWQINCINMLLEATKLTWKDLGLTVLKENKNSYFIVESHYYKLNHIFESIMLTEAESIASYLKKWLTKYLQGTDISGSQSKIDELVNQVQASWSQDQGRAALTQLANLAYALSYASGAGGGGGAAAGGGGGAAAGGGGGAAAGGGGVETLDRVKALLPKLTTDQKKQLLNMLTASATSDKPATQPKVEPLSRPANAAPGAPMNPKNKPKAKPAQKKNSV